MRVGFIGLGDQGSGMAKRLIECGYPTTLWARREASLEPFRTTSAEYADGPASLGERCEIVGVCVVDDAGVEQVVLGEDGILSGMQPGGVIVIHSTISLDVCARVAAAAEERDVTVVDAPVSGGGVAAAQGQLIVMVGGDANVVERVRPVLATYGSNVIHLGPLGSGLRTKLLNNILHVAHYALAQDAMTAGRALGIAAGPLGEALSLGSGNSFSLNVMVRAGGLDVLAPFVGALLLKDTTIVDALLRDNAIPAGSLVAVADEALRHLGFPRKR